MDAANNAANAQKTPRQIGDDISISGHVIISQVVNIAVIIFTVMVETVNVTGRFLSSVHKQTSIEVKGE